ncbi:MAG TPA: TetR/AcrR family transcriptional regulator [Brevundimonas sp.]|uniref:TetR/AcrR family transcriptional regulator n=1 Tax=Brevundimonas sp. TaxID=1871086 RepID=UPI002E16018B|nr:TetR/AcrR family transcriptional regulator [Brevundimonas sp.]
MGWSLFLQHGVQAVSMEQIAAAAGVSKVTAYKHFADKHDLFRTAIRMEMTRLESLQGAAALDGDGPIRDVLETFGRGLMSYLFSGPAMDFYAALAGELRRTPELAQAFYEAGPGKTFENLKSIFRRGCARGELAIEDLDLAADQFLGLLQGYSSFQIALGVEPTPLADTVDRRARAATELFLKTYGVP